jgi:enoyl-ACP reductase-like protein
VKGPEHQVLVTFDRYAGRGAATCQKAADVLHSAKVPSSLEEFFIRQRPLQAFASSHGASVSGTGGNWGMSPYNAAKGAVVNLTRALALDMGKKGVRVNAVCPSLTRTGMTEDMKDDKELPVGPHLRTGGSRRRDRFPRERRRELHDRR